MPSFLRINNKLINLEQISYLEIGDMVGATVGRGTSVSSGHPVALVIHFAQGERLSILDKAEAQQILERIPLAR